jgi:GDP-L-fucose synthase
MEPTSHIYVAGHQGMVGSAIWRALEREGYLHLIGRTLDELDLTDQTGVNEFFSREKPDYVFLAAAKVGGIAANNAYRAEFIYQNLAIQMNVIHASYAHGVRRLLFLGSSCIYPRACPQPIREECLLSGPLEPTNEPYAIAKIAGIKMCEAYNMQYGTQFICAMPTNLYGPHDNFDLETAHVLPALIRKFVEAKRSGEPCVTVWGSGVPRREFLHVDDAASACVHLMKLDFDTYSSLGLSHVNVGIGTDIAISDLAKMISKSVGYPGDICYDRSKPDGMLQKLLDTRRINGLGWRARVGLEEGIARTIEWYEQHHPCV